MRYGRVCRGCQPYEGPQLLRQRNVSHPDGSDDSSVLYRDEAGNKTADI